MAYCLENNNQIVISQKFLIFEEFEKLKESVSVHGQATSMCMHRSCSLFYLKLNIGA